MGDDKENYGYGPGVSNEDRRELDRKIDRLRDTLHKQELELQQTRNKLSLQDNDMK